MCLPCSPTKDQIHWLEKGSAAHQVLVEHVQGDNFKQQLTLCKHFHINLLIVYKHTSFHSCPYYNHIIYFAK